MLVDKGCRVMVFDLWGRGYSDDVDLPHDSRLYTTEILLAITSSPLAWTPEGFSIIGYSLGAALSVDFASYFPDLVKDIVLLAPCGIVRLTNATWQGRLMFSGLIPRRLTQWVVRRRLFAGLGHPNMGKTKPGVIATEKIPKTPASVSEITPLSRARPHVTGPMAVRWQLDNHAGFVNSYESSLRYSPLYTSQERRDVWGRVGLRKDKILIFAGTSDLVV